MENDPNKKDSKGKRILKKALRRNSKSSNAGQSSAEQGLGVSRSKSFENKRHSLDINDAAPLPKPDGARDAPAAAPPLPPPHRPKKLEIHESIQEAPAHDPLHGKELFLAPEEQRTAPREGVKRNLKRKLEEDSGAASTSGASAGNADSDAEDKDPSKDKKKKNRCAVCRKKVGLTGFECRCGGLFCAVHRYSDKHECSFDYRELGAQEIRRNNPVVVSQKIHKI